MRTSDARSIRAMIMKARHDAYLITDGGCTRIAFSVPGKLHGRAYAREADKHAATLSRSGVSSSLHFEGRNLYVEYTNPYRSQA